MLETIKKGFFLLDHKAKKALPLLAFLLLVSSMCELIGLGVIGLFLVMVSNFNSVFHKIPSGIQAILRHFSDKTIVLVTGLFLIVFFMGKFLLTLYTQQKTAYHVMQFSMRLKMRLIRGYQYADYLFHLQTSSTSIMQKIATTHQFSNNVILNFLGIFSTLFLLLSVLIFLLWVHPWITILLVILIGVLFLLSEFFLKKKSLVVGKTLAVLSGQMNGFVVQAMRGVQEARVFGVENRLANKIEALDARYAAAFVSQGLMQSIPRNILECFSAIFFVGVFLGVFFVSTNVISVIPSLGIFAAAFMRVLPNISRLVGQIAQLRSTAYTADVLYEEIQTLEKIHQSHLAEQVEKLPFEYFSLQQVSFAYPARKEAVLCQIDFSFKRGQCIGVMGKTGAGKSTLINMLLGLISPQQGQLLVDEKPIPHLRSWLNNIAYIPQSIFMFDASIKYNIALGAHEDDIDEEKLLIAIELAQLSEVIDALPQGMDTIIGENGIRLSGGQRQRVALARALYYERDIIIMDEATSALDSDTEEQVMRAIKGLYGIKTLIIVAHRLTTLRYCDIVYKLHEGRVVANDIG